MTDDYFEPLSYGRSMSVIMSRLLYTSWRVGPREAISNAFDQYKHPDTQTRSHWNEIYVELDSVKRIFTIEDHATGIQDIANFKLMGGNTTTTKTVGDIISTIYNPSLVGVFHVGKGSFAKMSTMTNGHPVTFYSNDGLEGIELSFKLIGNEQGCMEELGWDKQYNMRSEDFKEKSTIGLKIKVFDVVDDLTSLVKVRNLIAKDFGILIDRGLKIFIRDVARTGHTDWKLIHKPVDLYTHDEHKLSLQTPRRFMSYQLYKTNEKAKDPMNIDVYKQYIYVKSIHVPYKVQGWINCDWLELNVPRTDFQDNEILDQVMSTLDRHLKTNFERDTKPRTDKITGMKDMCDLMRKIVGILPEVFPNIPLNLIGPVNKSSKIRGIMNDEPTNKEDSPWEVQEDMRLVPRAGDPESGIIKTIGKGTKGKGEPGSEENGNKTTGAVEGGDHTVVRRREKSNRPKTDNINPSVEIKPDELGPTRPITYMINPSLMILNTSRQSVLTLLEMGIAHRLAILGPFFAEASAEFMTRNIPNPLTIEEYRAHVSDIYSRIMG